MKKRAILKSLLILLPILVTTLMKAGIIPRRYGNAA